MRTLEEAIRYCEEVALLKDIEAKDHNPRYTGLIRECKECAADHRQLAEWLRELKAVHDEIDDIHTLSFCPNCGADMRGDDHDQSK